MTQFMLSSLTPSLPRGRTVLSLVGLLSALLVCSLWSTPATAQNYGDAFYQFSNSAKASGFGNAYVAGGSDASSVKWNPAGIAGVESYDVTGVFAQGLGLDRQYTSLAGAYTAPNIGTFALSIERSGVTDIPRYDDTNSQQGTFSVAQFVTGVSYARELAAGLSVGGSLNYLRQDLEVQTDQGYSIDVGARYAMDNFFAGASIQSALGELSPDQLPKTLRVGAGGSFQGVTAEVNYGVWDITSSSGTDDFINVGVGYEQQIQQVVVGARGGLRDGNLTLGGSVGGSIDGQLRFTVDYAFVNDRSPLFDNSHRIGISVSGQ